MEKPFILLNRYLGRDLAQGHVEALLIDSRGETTRTMHKPVAVLKRYARRHGLEWIAPVRLLALWRAAEAVEA
jgi:hypothetical protein